MDIFVYGYNIDLGLVAIFLFGCYLLLKREKVTGIPRVLCLMISLIAISLQGLIFAGLI